MKTAVDTIAWLALAATVATSPLVLMIATTPEPAPTCTTDLQCERMTGEPVSLEAVEH